MVTNLIVITSDLIVKLNRVDLKKSTRFLSTKINLVNYFRRGYSFKIRFR